MAYEEALTCISREAAADLSSHQFKFVQQTATGINLASASSDVLGVLQDKPAALGRAGSVATAGVTKLWCSSTAGTAIAAGDTITSSSLGTGVVAVLAGSTAGTQFLQGEGEAMEALSTGATAILSVLIDKR